MNDIGLFSFTTFTLFTICCNLKSWVRSGVMEKRGRNFFEAEASGFILKDATVKEFLGTIRSSSTMGKNSSAGIDWLTFFSCN